MFEIDALWAGLCGGFVGSFAVTGVLYLNFHSKYKDFFFNKEQYKTKAMVTKLENDVANLKIQAAALHVASGIVDKKGKSKK